MSNSRLCWLVFRLCLLLQRRWITIFPPLCVCEVNCFQCSLAVCWPRLFLQPVLSDCITGPVRACMPLEVITPCPKENCSPSLASRRPFRVLALFYWAFCQVKSADAFLFLHESTKVLVVNKLDIFYSLKESFKSPFICHSALRAVARIHHRWH